VKQHITVEEFLSLDGNRGELLIWAIQGYPDYTTYNAESLTIGKMIEILRRKSLIFIEPNFKDTGFTVRLVNGFGCSDYDEHVFKHEELCDALWEAVKFRLESEVKSIEQKS